MPAKTVRRRSIIPEPPIRIRGGEGKIEGSPHWKGGLSRSLLARALRLL